MTSRPFTAEELSLLELLCAGDWPGADVARVQLQSARHGGHPHPMESPADNDACFAIEIVGDVPLIGRPGHHHASGFTVHHDGDVTGEIELAITNGLIDGVEYHWYTLDAPKVLPTRDQLWTDGELRAQEQRAREASLLSRRSIWQRLRGRR